MPNTVEKLRCLEMYAVAANVAADSVLDKAITKLLARERLRVQEVSQRLQQDLRHFEQTYHLPSQAFYAQYSQGESGDAMDFIEWAATIEMLDKVEKHIRLLDVVQ